MNTFRNLSAGLAFGFCLAAAAGPAQAGQADRFLGSMQGKWRGSGKVQISKRSKSTPIRCSITSKLNESKRQLENSGRCATTSGKETVSGAIRYSRDGNKLTGVFLNSVGDIKITKSSGSLSGDTLTLSSTAIETGVGRVTRSRNIIKRLGARKFSMSIQVFEDGKWQNRGSITFEK